ERPPSMDALLAVLQRDPGKQWRRGLLLAASLGAAVALGTLAVEPGAVCGGGADDLAGVWDSPRRAAVEAAFASSAQPFAQESFQTVARAFDAYSARWRELRVEACEATHVRGERSDELFDLRMQCLERKREDLRALADLFARADADIVKNAVVAAQRLPDL